MKKIVYVALFLVLPLISDSQCDPSSYDWGEATFGVSPNPTLGETFETATQFMPFADEVYVLVPTNVGDINPAYAALNLQIDSISLDSITIYNGLNDVQMSTIGLNVTCNNNNDSPDPCMFYPGNAYCGDIAGTPTVAGVFDVKIFVTVHFFAFGSNQSLPYNFEGYTLEVIGETKVNEVLSSNLSLSQNTPNPANDFTTVGFQVAQSQDVTFTIFNLVGEVVFKKDIKAKKGDNQFRIDTNGFETGVYLYTIQTNDKKLTRKMIIQHG